MTFRSIKCMTNEHPLPDGNMRYSLFEAWLSNKQTAMQRYFKPEEEREHFENKWMLYGSLVARTLEQRPLPDWINIACKTKEGVDVPLVYDVNEYRIIHEIDGYMIRGSIDTYSHNLHKFADHKAVKAKWSQNKVNAHKQLAYYSVLIEQANEWVDDECHIICIPVDCDENDIVRLTGEPALAIPRVVTKDERDAMKQLMVDTARDISIVYQSYLNGYITL